MIALQRVTFINLFFVQYGDQIGYMSQPITLGCKDWIYPDAEIRRDKPPNAIKFNVLEYLISHGLFMIKDASKRPRMSILYDFCHLDSRHFDQIILLRLSDIEFFVDSIQRSFGIPIKIKVCVNSGLISVPWIDSGLYIINIPFCFLFSFDDFCPDLKAAIKEESKINNISFLQSLYDFMCQKVRLETHPLTEREICFLKALVIFFREPELSCVAKKFTLCHEVAHGFCLHNKFFSLLHDLDNEIAADLLAASFLDYRKGAVFLFNICDKFLIPILGNWDTHPSFKSRIKYIADAPVIDISTVSEDRLKAFTESAKLYL